VRFLRAGRRVAPALLLVIGCDSAPRHTPPLVEFQAIAQRLIESDNPYLGTGLIHKTREELQTATIPSRESLGLQMRLGQALLKAGELDAALAEVEKAISWVDLETRPDAAFFHRARGLIHLRQAEMQNCIQRHNAQCCIFPLRGEGVHSRREPALRARDDYLAALAIEPGNLLDRWLLNIVYMALGEYPDDVPDAHLIPPSAFRSEFDIGKFPDIAPQLGLDTFDLCGGAIMDDFDNDGRLDIVTSTYDPNGPLHYFRSLGNGEFEDVSRTARLTEQLGGLNCLGADYDNDGRRDVLVLRGAWLHDDGQIRNSLLRNRPDGTFIDVTREVGLAWPARPTQAAAWGDFDNDGDLDLYVGNESRREIGPPPGDYPSQLFRNDGGRGFTDVAPPAGVTAPEGRSFAAWFFDFDNDGWLDLFVGAYAATVEHIAAAALDLPHGGETARLYRNNGDGTFDDISDRVGLDGIYLPMGANFGDLDNDGFLDIYLGTGEPDYRTLVPNVMLRNDRGRRFQDVTESGGFGHLQKGHGIAFGDIDDDGDQDVYHQLGGFYPGDRFRNALFHNPGHGNRFIFLELEGRQSNRDAVGARVRVVIEEGEEVREIHRAVGSVSSFGGSPAWSRTSAWTFARSTCSPPRRLTPS
jgi:hypothetical protein